MKALFYTGTLQSELQETDEPVAGPGECVVEVAHCGICGSDMHAYHGHDPRRVPPMILGHEAVGIARGGPFDGKRVVINPLMSCGTCRACRSGSVHLCAERRMVGMAVPGAFAQRLAVANENLSEIPEGLSFENAALTEPLACAVHAVRLGLEQLKIPISEARVSVLGGGAIGLLCAAVFADRGVKDLWIAETNPLRRNVLESAVAAKAYDPRDGGPDAETCDIVLDAVGIGPTRAASSALAVPGGTIVHIGLQDNDAGLDTRRLTLQEITFIGVYCYSREDFADALEILADGRVTCGDWAVIRSLDQGAQSFSDIHEGKAPPKIILSMT